MFNNGTIIIQSLNIKELKLLELQITQKRHPLSIKWLSSTALKIRKYLLNVHKMKGAHLQCASK